MRQLEPREVYLLLYGPDGLGAHWKLRALRKELMADPEIVAIREQRQRARKSATDLNL